MLLHEGMNMLLLYDQPLGIIDNSFVYIFYRIQKQSFNFSYTLKAHLKTVHALKAHLKTVHALKAHLKTVYTLLAY